MEGITVNSRAPELPQPATSVASTLLGLCPFMIMTAVTCLWLRLWPSLVTEHLLVFILSLGLLLAHQVGVMTTCDIAMLKLPYWNPAVSVPLVGGCALAYLDNER